eukprot:m.74063 g.74063  ORF g.74063 m.74063 type:complete len:362 (-) comp8044_c0_seq2:177-1262(-)
MRQSSFCSMRARSVWAVAGPGAGTAGCALPSATTERRNSSSSSSLAFWAERRSSSRRRSSLSLTSVSNCCFFLRRYLSAASLLSCFLSSDVNLKSFSAAGSSVSVVAAGLVRVRLRAGAAAGSLLLRVLRVPALGAAVMTAWESAPKPSSAAAASGKSALGVAWATLRMALAVEAEMVGIIDVSAEEEEEEEEMPAKGKKRAAPAATQPAKKARNEPAKQEAKTPAKKEAKTPAKTPAKEEAKTPAKTPASAKRAKKTLSGGVVVEDFATGDGPVARKGRVTVQYRGWLAKNKKEFDKGRIDFNLGRGEVIKGWDVGVAGMAVGGKRRISIPAKMGYGRQGAPPDIPANADLVFDVTLLKA